ncbi:hypothetical protein SSS_00257 [Sarcoptes scabiei]|nr:hypothetical protein SSS_00257 [Sarcoptes scabiei]
MFVFFLRKQKIVPHLVNPHELVMIDAIESTLDNNTLGDDDNHETNTETTERNISRNEFNPLLVVNPVKKPPRLGIPDVSSSKFLTIHSIDLLFNRFFSILSLFTSVVLDHESSTNESISVRFLC